MVLRFLTCLCRLEYVINRKDIQLCLFNSLPKPPAPGECSLLRKVMEECPDINEEDVNTCNYKDMGMYKLPAVNYAPPPPPGGGVCTKRGGGVWG